MFKLIIIQTVAPDYRSVFFKTLMDRLGDDFELYSGDYYFDKSIASEQKIPFKKIRNHYFLSRRALFQSGILKFIFSKAVIVLEMNPRILSNWVLLILRKLLGRTTVLWGHAWPRKGKNSKSDIVRGWMRALSNAIITYTNNQKEELALKMPSKTILAAPNALYSKKDMSFNKFAQEPSNLIYVGRLTPAKKPAFLVEAFCMAIQKLPPEMKLIIVGEGSERSKISEIIRQNKLKNRIILKGHLSDKKELAQLYATSIFSVSPGYVGLSITQSFGFGVPMLISRNENHSPEIEAAIEGDNAIYFESDNYSSFRESVLTFIKNKSYWVENRTVIQENCSDNYSVEAMAQVFINLVTSDA